MASHVPVICRPSPIANDWVQKGFHIQVSGIELKVWPGHRNGMVVLKAVFPSDSRTDVDAAKRVVEQRCLSSQMVRDSWVQTLARAMEYLNGYTGELADK